MKGHTKCNFNRRNFTVTNNAANRIGIFGTGIMFLGHSGVSQAVAGLFQLQLCPVSGSSDIQLSEYTCTYWYLLEGDYKVQWFLTEARAGDRKLDSFCTAI
jgi:hypothetical protein